jgi:hypothetical protein
MARGTRGTCGSAAGSAALSYVAGLAIDELSAEPIYRLGHYENGQLLPTDSVAGSVFVNGLNNTPDGGYMNGSELTGMASFDTIYGETRGGISDLFRTAYSKLGIINEDSAQLRSLIAANPNITNLICHSRCTEHLANALAGMSGASGLTVTWVGPTIPQATAEALTRAAGANMGGFFARGDDLVATLVGRNNLTPWNIFTSIAKIPCTTYISSCSPHNGAAYRQMYMQSFGGP